MDFDSYFKERVDVGDLDSVAQGSPELRAAIVVHVIEENIQANTIKREQPGLDPMARFNLAHDRASSTEATMFGAVSRQEFTGKNSIFLRFVDGQQNVKKEFTVNFETPDALTRTPRVVP